MNGFPKEISRCVYKLLYDDVLKELRDSYGTKLLLKNTPRCEMCSKIKDDTIVRVAELITFFNAYIRFDLSTRTERERFTNICYPSWLHMFLFERQMQ